MEVCYPSWAIKKDFEEKKITIFKLEDYIEWD